MKIALGVSGGIAAYKAVEIVREFQKHNVEVVVVMTRSACRFVSPLTFQTISHNRVYYRMFTPAEEWEAHHIFLAKEIDLLLVAPATANIIGKFANGIADDLLSTLFLAVSCPVVVAPAMHQRMFLHPQVKENLERLRQLGVKLVEPEVGYLAGGDEGVGRLAEVSKIVQLSLQALRKKTLAGVTFLITAGPTCEDIDPVRYITNRSTGKMGFALAEAAAARGAEVTLISGPTTLPPPIGVKLITGRSASQMREKVLEQLEGSKVVIKAAAVTDFRPRFPSPKKIKKDVPLDALELELTEDILAEIGQQKGERLVVGFAAESEGVVPYALKKLKEKKLDLIIANDISLPGSGFGSDTNTVTIITADGKEIPLPQLPKREVAEHILDKIEEILADASR
ncbi:bifunctional 4'-phosphopantothenoylcysteine decarboxylase/phosphopantothenoylcysteine synthetase [bacterium (candidate division B38) B3_B38]|nr:MAG: bifunctional 4'-phosphopantothenoylcysteine decarboxylase/phosphopantothenoylcysteine synthetase [bacterium (candidate division B38) B3_B38]